MKGIPTSFQNFIAIIIQIYVQPRHIMYMYSKHININWKIQYLQKMFTSIGQTDRKLILSEIFETILNSILCNSLTHVASKWLKEKEKKKVSSLISHVLVNARHINYYNFHFKMYVITLIRQLQLQNNKQFLIADSVTRSRRLSRIHCDHHNVLREL